MGQSPIPYDPYHPHLGYTLVVACLAWLSVMLYSRLALHDYPKYRVALYSIAIGLPLFGEGGAFIIFLLRPDPDTPIGSILTHFHAEVVQRIPIDNFLSPSMITVALLILGLLFIFSLARYVYGTMQLDRLLADTRPLEATSHRRIAQKLRRVAQGRKLPAILVAELDVPLAFTTGLLRPRIYITSGLLSLLSVQETVAVLCHELAHIQRHDNLWNGSVRLLRDIVWFLPGSHMAWQAMIASQDEACDALAAQMTKQPLTLAQALVKVAGANSRAPIPALGFANSFALADHSPRPRIEHMIRVSDEALDQRRWVVPGAYMLGALMLLLSVLPALVGS